MCITRGYRSANPTETWVNVAGDPPGDVIDNIFNIYDYLHEFEYQDDVAYQQVEVLTENDNYDYDADAIHYVKRATTYQYDTTNLQTRIKIDHRQQEATR